MVLDIVKACGGLLLFMAAWFAVQSVIRRRMSCSPGADVLIDMAHGCGNCEGGGSCGGGRRHGHGPESDTRRQS